MEIIYSQRQHAFIVLYRSRLCTGRKTIIAAGATRADALIAGMARLGFRFGN